MKSITTSRPHSARGIILLGPPKSGKTIFVIRTFPNLYVCDLDNNLQGPVDWLDAKKDLPNFSYDTIALRDDGTTVPPEKRWSRMVECLKAAVASPEIDTIFVDGLSAMSDNLILHILAEEKIELMRIQDWLSYQNLMKKVISFLRSCGKVIILSAHTNVEPDELDKVLKHFVAIPSKLRDTIAGLFTDAWCTEYKPGPSGTEGKYALRTLATARMSLGNTLQLPHLVDLDDPIIAERVAKIYTTP